MDYPQLLLIPIFILADYLLTIAGARLIDQKYSQHFRSEHYELNPVWQTQVASKKWFNPRHTLLTTLLTALLILGTEFGDLPESLVRGILGFLLVFFGIVIGRHVGNILTFQHVIKQPSQISGQVTLAHSLSLLVSLYQMALVLVPLVLIWLFEPGPFTSGALLAGLFQILVHLGWIYQNRKKR